MVKVRKASATVAVEKAKKKKNCKFGQLSDHITVNLVSLVTKFTLQKNKETSSYRKTPR
jgi:hypothetical protein